MTAPFVRRESSPFLKRVLIPFWILRMLVLLVGLGLYGLTMAALIAFTDDILQLESEYNTNLQLSLLKALNGIIMGILLLCLILEFVCVIKRGRKTLSPGFFLGTNIVQSTFITVMFILSMIGARTPTTVGISVAILLLFLGFLIYAAVVYHKYRKGALNKDFSLEGGNVSHQNVYTKPAQ